MVNRLVAYKVRVVDLFSGYYVSGEKEFDPDLVVVNGLQVGRCNIIGFVVGKNINDRFEALSIDDGSAVIDVRNFGFSFLKSFEIGDCVNIIGRIKEFNKARYIVCESCKKVDVKWLVHRKKELETENDGFVSADDLIVDLKKKPVEEVNPIQPANKSNKIEAKNEVVEENLEEDEFFNPVDSLLNTIRELDKGSGVDVDDLIKLKGPKAEQLIMTLLQEGELFEVRPGMIKVLE
jgi:RPA family protein